MTDSTCDAVRRSLPVLAMVLSAVVLPRADAQDRPPRILSIQAHPDDETTYAATIYGVTHHLDGEVDAVVITDGSGGFDYAMLAEPLYDKVLAVEPEARTHLPAVRKREMLAGGEIIGLRNVFFLDEYDHEYTLDADTVLGYVWDAEDVKVRLREILARGDYDFVFTLLPASDTHGHHKSASILALRAVADLPPEHRPVVLGALPAPAGETPSFDGLDAYPETVVTSSGPAFSFDIRRPLEVDSLLTYRVVVNWLIAEHKSQGTLQLLVNAWDVEHFWLYGLNGPGAGQKARDLFARLHRWRP